MSGGLYLLVLAPAWAATQVPRTQPAATDAAMAVVPVFMEEPGPRSSGRLREQLRQTADGASTAAQPYRLSSEERQRLREQLRQQAASPPQQPR